MKSARDILFGKKDIPAYPRLIITAFISGYENCITRSIVHLPDDKVERRREMIEAYQLQNPTHRVAWYEVVLLTEKQCKEQKYDLLVEGKHKLSH